MNYQLRDLGLKLLAVVLVLGGLGMCVMGYLGVRRNYEVALQLPYLASGGVIGLALIAIGAVVVVQRQMQEQSRRAGLVTEALEEWKDAALAELRAFLDTATLELEVPAVADHRRERDVSAVLS